MANPFEWEYLTTVVNEIKPESNFLTQKLIGNKIVNEPAEQVVWAMQTGTYKPAPLNTIGDPATKVDVQLHLDSKSAVAPQILLEDRIQVYDALTGMMPGQSGPVSVAKLNANDRQRIAYKVAELRKSIDRTIELMLAQIVTTGKINLDKFKYDFGVPASNITTASTLWDASGVNVYKELLSYVRAYAKLNGYRPNTIIVGSDAADALMSNSEVQALLNNRNLAVGGMTNKFMNNDQVIYHGTLTGIGDIYEYIGTYQDDTGAMVDYIPSNTLVLANSDAFELHYGAIADYDVGGFVKRAYFSKMKTAFEGKTKYIYVESHPLPILKSNLGVMTVEVL